jgi:hypothetical protein
VLLAGFALPSDAVVVQYTGTLEAGLGDPGDIQPPPGPFLPGGTNPNICSGTNPATCNLDPGVNGLPACGAGLTRHSNASGPVAGIANVNAARSVIFDLTAGQYQNNKFIYGTMMATTGGTNAFNQPLQAHSGPAGPNGGVFPLTVSSAGGGAANPADNCTLLFTPNFLGTNLVNRTHMTTGGWPAEPITAGQRPGQQDLTLGSGRGFGGTSLAPFIHTFPGQTALNQRITVTRGPNTFGGGARLSGGGRIDLGAIVGGGGTTITGFWLSGPRILGHGITSGTGGANWRTQLVTQMNAFNHSLFCPAPAAPCVPVTLAVENFPFTTGRVVQNESGGNYVSHRTSTGFDNRNAAGTTGTLQVVAPWNGNLLALQLWFGGTQKLTFNFAPEPGASALLAAGVVAVLGLHFRRRAK